MKFNFKEKKGITLIALVITIIVLLILAGVTIATLTGDNGILKKAQTAKTETEKSVLQEEISLAIHEINLEELSKGNHLTLATLANGQLAEKLADITAELGTNEITGEYKNYEYIIDQNFKVEIGEKAVGIKPTGTAEILTTGYMFEGEGTVQIKVTASISEGTITGIEAPSDATPATDTSATEMIYTVTHNGTYIFMITGDTGRNTSVEANVNNFVSIPHINISDVKSNEFTINVDSNCPDGAITEFKYYVDNVLKSPENTTNKSFKVENLNDDTEYSNIKVVAYINESTSKESNSETVTTLMVGGIPYQWSEIVEIAQVISNTDTITYDIEEANVIVKGVPKTLKVGDITKVDGKKVRILGFNHDTLASTTSGYGSTGKAGISFEYVDFITDNYYSMNGTDTNSGGWANCALRTTLNETILNSLSIKNDIKEVKKPYIKANSLVDVDSDEAYSDKLWLLSCGEIWSNGYNKGVTRGYAIETEGSQYKYYQKNLGNTDYNQNPTEITKKQKAGSSSSYYWWLRSPFYNNNLSFCAVYSDGYCNYDTAHWAHGVAPGFCI